MPRGSKYGKWREEDMAEALIAMRERGVGLNKAAKLYSIPKATLKRHLDGKNRFAAESRKVVGSSSDIPLEIEMKIKDHLLNLTPSIFGLLTTIDLRRLAYQVAEANGIPHRFNQDKKMAGKTWYYNFMRRHPDLARATGLPDRGKNEENHEMESSSVQDLPHVEAQEDSNSVDENSTSEPFKSSPEPPEDFEESMPEKRDENPTQDDSLSLEIVSRLSSDDSSIGTKPEDVAGCSGDSTSLHKPLLVLLPGQPENPGFSTNPQTDLTIKEEIDLYNVDKVYEDNFFSDDVQATSSSESTPSRKRCAPEFLPINAEIKRIGVEISEEHAKQLKNDIRRLSPVLVSLRERTLGEISLTSDSGLFEDDNQSIKVEVKEEPLEDPLKSSHLDGDTSGAVLTDSSITKSNSSQDELTPVVKCQSDLSEGSNSLENAIKSDSELSVKLEVKEKSKPPNNCESRLVNDVKNVGNLASPSRNSCDFVEIQNFSSPSIESSDERLNGQRELMIVLSRVDDDDAESKIKEPTENKATNERTESEGAEVKSIEERTVLACAVVEKTDNLSKYVERYVDENRQVLGDNQQNVIQCSAKDNLVLVGDFCLSPKYLKNDQLTRKSPKVVIERTLQSVSVSSSPFKSSADENIERTETSSRKNLDCVRRTLADSLIESNDEETEDAATSDLSANEEDPLRLESPDVVAEPTNDPQESIDTETETETGSDSSELNSMTSIHLSDCVEPVNSASSCPETDSLVSDEVQSEIITRLEPERPEAFTEDSAESLALATGARDEVRSDGSDSGLGSEIPGDPGPAPAPESDSETSFLDRIPDDILSDKDKAVNPLEAFVSDAGTSGTQPQQQQQQQIPLPSFPSPPKSSLKRRLTDCMEGEPSPKRINTEDPMRKKRNIQFDAVTVYYFPRSQGFTCVPSQGGSTLGMSATHTHAERFSLAEHATEQRRIHRARLAQLRSERAANCVTEAASSSEDPSDDTDEEPSDTEELDIDSYYFLQPVPTWQRRALLRAAGVRRIDAVEKDECRDIRASREHCGCGCKGYCDPESCPCSRANVKCQVDRAGFPCGCSRDGCANSSGRIEFNPVRVRTHFIHTLMRLQLEKKQRDEDRTDHDLLANNQTGRGPMREVPVMLPSGLGPMDHPNVITGDPVSCINAGGFTTLHYDSHETTAASCQPIVHGGREDSLDLYAIRDDCYTADSENVGVDNTQNSQRKLHPEFGQAFQAFPGQQPAVSFPQGAYQDYQGYQNLASTSRSQFQPQFQAIPPPANSGFSHYAYEQDPNVMQPACQPHPGPPHHHTVYETPFPQEEILNAAQQQYTNLNSVQPMNAVVQQMGKLEPFSELLAGRYSYYGEVEPQPIGDYHSNSSAKIEPEKSPNVVQTTAETNAEDCDENFGEIIKKSMVETVSA